MIGDSIGTDTSRPQILMLVSRASRSIMA